MLAFAQVFVQDMPRALAWYRDVLGFTIGFAYGEPAFYAQVSRDGAVFNLRHTDESPWIARPEDDDLLSVRVDVGDARSLFAELRRRGVEVHQPLRTEPWGQETFIVRDPDGNLLGFGSPT